jgi:hypothetical protein
MFLTYWPQIIWLFLAIFGLGYGLYKHGKPKEGRESFWITLVATLVSFILVYCGGFFKGFF